MLQHTNTTVARAKRDTLHAIVEQVDLVNRTLDLRAGDSRVRVDVPPECEILVNRQRVRLHLLQPTDRVTVTVEEVGGGRLARQIKICTHLA